MVVFFCNDQSHAKKDCEKFKMKCKNCNGRGHMDNECNMANKIKSKVLNGDIFDDEEDAIEEQTQNEHSMVGGNENEASTKNNENNDGDIREKRW